VEEARGSTRRWDLDQVVAFVSAVGLVAVGAVLLLDFRGGTARLGGRAGEIAQLTNVDGAVRCRVAGTLVWETVGPDQPLAAGDAVFVQPGGSATIAFRAGALVDLEERSLVIVEPPDAEADRVRVVEGAIVAAAGSQGLSVQTRTGQAVVAPGGALEVDAGAGLQLLEGRAIVDGEERGASPRVALVTPARSHRLYVQEFPASVALRWDGDAARTFSLQVSRERSFERPVASGPGAAGLFEVEVEGPGAWYWRIVDGSGAAVSEVRKFMAIVDRPPRPFSPAPGEIVLAPQGVQVPFWWTSVAGAARYRVEVAADAAFRQIALSEPANGPGLWVALDLTEGIYYWRVRAERPSESEHLSPASAGVAFRLIRRPVLDAPQLFDAAIEEGHAR
jgi:hypothetical protein